MKCPECNEQAISRFRYLIKLTMKPFKCHNCGTFLKFGKLHRRVLFYTVLITGFIFGFFERSIENTFEINISWYIILVTMVLTIIIVDWIAWRLARLEEVEDK